MLFNEQSNASGSLFRVSDDLWSGSNKLWVGGVKIDDKELIVASAAPRYSGDRLDGFWLALGTTDPACHGLGCYAELVPNSAFPGAELFGYLRYRDQYLDDVFTVTAVYATNTDGTSRLDVTIECPAEQLRREHVRA